MSRTALVTGVNGFVGHHLARELVEQGWQVTGLGKDETADQDLAGFLAQYIRCDLTDYEEVKGIPLKGVSALINLAGLAAVGPSFEQPDLYMRVNTGVLESLCRSVAEQASETRIISISSGAVYKSGQPMPLTESSQLDPTSSPYAKSKIAMEDLARKYRDEGLDCVVARPFNHIGPGQDQGFLLPDLYAKVKAAHCSGGNVMVGNLTTRRDYTDVRDVAKAYVALAGQEVLSEGTYNVCSGRSLSGEEVLSLLIQALGYDHLTTTVDEKLFRPSDAPDLFGDNSRLRNETGWQPSIPIEKTVEDFIKSVV